MAAVTSKHQIEMGLEQFDLHILNSIYSLRYVTAKHIVACQPTKKQISSLDSKSAFHIAVKVASQQLSKLYKQGYLKRISKPVGKLFGPHIYALGESSLSALSQQPGIDSEEIKKQLQDTLNYLESKSADKKILIENCLGVNLFRSVLNLTLKVQSGAGWLYNENNAPYWIQPSAKRDLTIQAKVETASIPPFARRYFNQSNEETLLQGSVDAMFILNFTDHKVGFIYKRDNGRESYEEFAANLLCYYNWFEQKQHQDAFGTSHFRVLIETNSKQRMNNIIDRSARSVKEARDDSTEAPVFWFTLKNNLSLHNPDRILEPIWRVGYANDPDERHGLLEFTSLKDIVETDTEPNEINPEDEDTGSVK